MTSVMCEVFLSLKEMSCQNSKSVPTRSKGTQGSLSPIRIPQGAWLLVSAFSVRVLLGDRRGLNSDSVLHAWSLEPTAFLNRHITQSLAFKAFNSYLKCFIFFNIFYDIFQKLFLLSYKVVVHVVTYQTHHIWQTNLAKTHNTKLRSHLFI
jgi:hypothetical protein